MGILTIQTIERNEGKSSQQYRIEYNHDGGPWMAGPTLSYLQAQQAPAGLLPLMILMPSDWVGGTIETRIVTICGQVETNGPIDPVIIDNASPVTVYWGYKSTLPITLADILAGFTTSIVHNAPITADFSTAVSIPMFLWLAYPNTEETKNYYQDTVEAFNAAPLGTPDDLMDTPTEVSGFTLHVSNYITFSNNPIMFSHV